MKHKFETKSQRVKGLSFHPTRPWILASLHTGAIQLWDYRIATLLDRFDEHDGPVRGICFHPNQPLFVSGGDDYRIKVWNYKLRKCLFTLLGHLDYIRTVEFHHEQPWILSASDDQTIRIWNWQNRECVSIFTGHNHYVMSARFHPKEDLVVSSSLDQTVRVWDISGLHKKGASHSPSDDSLGLRSNDLFGSTDVVVKYLLEGHDRGVNWADFSGKLPLIVSGADDRQIKLWRMNDTRAWEVDTLRGHFSNVSCVIFHPRRELLLSNSEDKTIRVWDMSARTCVKVIRRDHDRFWTLAAHPNLNLFAAGHDSGLIIFKLERERPVHTFNSGSNTLFYISDGPNRRYLRSHDIASRRDVPLISLRRTAGFGFQSRMISYNAAEHAVLITTVKLEVGDASHAAGSVGSSSSGSSTSIASASGDEGQYDLYRIPSGDSRASEPSAESKRGKGLAAIFVARNRFVVLERAAGGLAQLVVKSLENEVTRTIELAEVGVDYMFPAGTGRVLLRSEDKVIMYDVQRRRVVAELATPDVVKDAIWSSQNEKTATLVLMCKDSLIMTTRKLEQTCSVHESIPIKSGAWDDSGVFVYTTLNHVKYLLPNGDSGIIRTVDTPIYITAVRGNRIHCLDRECQCQLFAIDPTEYLFKLALYQRRFDVVMKMVQQSHLIGQSIISYLQKKGYPEIALHFVKDDRSRFNLALECGNIEIALESAKRIDDADCWLRLGNEALAQGNHQVVEMAYQRTKNFEKLSFLYLITGNQVKLQKMMKIAEIRKDAMGRFHNAVFLGDMEERVRVLRESGQLPLAYLTARTHGLDQEADEMFALLTPEQQENIASEEQVFMNRSIPTLLMPSTPLIRSHDSNWPLLTHRKPLLTDIGSAAAAASDAMTPTTDSDEDAVDGVEGLGGDEGDWAGADLVIPADGEHSGGDDPDGEHRGGDGDDDDVDGWETNEIDLPNIEDRGALAASGSASSVHDSFVAPQPGPSTSAVWAQTSKIAYEHAAAGAFDTAMQLLNRQVGIINFPPLKTYFMTLFQSSHGFLPAFPSLPALAVPLTQPQQQQSMPRPLFDTTALTELLKKGSRQTLEGKFRDALTSFTEVLHKALFTCVDNRAAAELLQQSLEISREYALALRLELHRRANVQDPVRSLELSAYFTQCKLQVPHLQLALRSAMTAAYKIKNFAAAAEFARRLLDLHPKQDLATQAKQIVRYAEQHNTDEHKLNYDERNPFVVCAISFVPIYLNTPNATCPFCGASYLPEHQGKLCPTCQLAQIGFQASGLYQVQRQLFPQRY